MAQKLKAQIKKQIVADWDLFTTTGQLTGLKPMSLYTAIKNNSRTIHQYHVLEGIARKLSLPINDILEEVN